MNSVFGSWKDYVLKNESILRIDDNQVSADVIYIGDTKVCLYSGKNLLSAGIWLQSDDCRLRIYSRTSDSENIIWRSFNGNHEEGPVHQHAFIEIGYVVEGCAYQSFFGKEYQFKQGDFWLVDRNCYHADQYRPANLFTAYIGIPSELFDSAFFDAVGNDEIQNFLFLSLLQQKKSRQFLHFIPKESNEEEEILMEKLIREIIEQKIGYYDISKGLLARLIDRLSSKYEFLLTRQEKQKMNDLLFREVVKYINENYRTATIQDLVDRFHYNEDFYNRLIKEYSGFTYSEYLKNVRLMEAEKMLLTTNLPIEQIAEQVGYQSRGYFYRLFMEKYTMTPAKYRQLNHN